MGTQEVSYSLIADYYTEHYDEILGYVAKGMQYAEGAEDVVQDVFVRLLRSDKMITPVTLPSLVYTTARHLIADYWRHRRVVEEYEHYFSGREEAVSVYGAAEMMEILERGMARLSKTQCAIYRMNLYEGRKVSEISETLHLNYKSVENRLGAARKEMRRYVKRMLA